MMDLGWIGDIVQSVQAQGAQDKNLVNQWAGWDLGWRATKSGRRREDTAIQRRVADAKAAGIHPLFALGANVSNSAAVPLFDSSPVFNESAGRGVGNALSKLLDGPAKERQEAELDLVKSQAELNRAKAREADDSNFVDLSAVSSGLSRAAQRANSQQDQGEPVKIYDMPEMDRSQYGSKIEAWKKATGRTGDYDIIEGPFGPSLHKRSYGKAQEHEDVYGEMSDWFTGPPIWFRDFIDTRSYNVYRHYGEQGTD